MISTAKNKFPIRILMPRMINLIACGLICIFLVSCSFFNKYDPGLIERAQNQKHLKLLRKGMTKQEVLAIMGQPLIHEKYNKPNIWFYYIDWDWADAAVTSKECTPLFFKNNRLVTWGAIYYEEYKQREWLFDNTKLFESNEL